MKKIIVLFFMMIGLSAYAVDYNGMKEVVFDAENALGKTVKFNGKIYKIGINSDWYYKKRASVLVTDLENRGGAIMYVFFNKSFNERIKKLDKDDLVTVTCRIKRLGIGIQCDLIDFNMFVD